MTSVALAEHVHHFITGLLRADPSRKPSHVEDEAKPETP